MDGGGWRGGPGCVAVNEGVHRAGSASGERGLRRADCEARSGRTQPHQLQTQVEQKLADAGQSHRACLELQPCPSTRSSRSEMET